MKAKTKKKTKAKVKATHQQSATVEAFVSKPFVNTGIPAINETRTRVQNNICINDLGVTISSTNLSSDSIFETRRCSVVDPRAVEA